MELQLQNKVIIVSGGAKGIGEDIVKLLAEEGAIPVIIGRNEEDNLKTFNEIKASGKNCVQIVAELTKPEDCKSAVEKTINIFGRIDGLVNNAEINTGINLEQDDYDKFIASLHQNLIHYYLLAHYALPALKVSKGSIVNIILSTAGNGGKNALTREWAVELLKYGIRVNAVIAESRMALYEKWINTLPNPEKKLKEVTLKIALENKTVTMKEIANIVVFLLSDKSSHTTGQQIHVDGGDVHLNTQVANAF